MRAFLISLSILLLTACSAPPVTQVEKAPLPQKEQTEEVLPQPVLPQEQVIRYQADTTLVADTLYAEDGTQLVHYAVRVPYLTAWREDGTPITETKTAEEERALAAAETFNTRFAVWYEEQTIREMAEAAAEELKWFREEALEWYGGYQIELTCSIYQTEQLVSVSGTYYAYTGGAHPNTYHLGWTFDLNNGTFFGEESLGDYSELKDAVTQELLRQARERAEGFDMLPEEFFWPEYEEIIADWPSYAVSLDENGMQVIFSPYELAAYAAGSQEFSVTYNWMSQYLDAAGEAALNLH